MLAENGVIWKVNRQFRRYERDYQRFTEFDLLTVDLLGPWFARRADRAGKEHFFGGGGGPAAGGAKTCATSSFL